MFSPEQKKARLNLRNVMMSEIVEVPTQEIRRPITPMDMLQIAVDKGADLDRLEKLMDMSERWERNEARKAYVQAMAQFKANPPKIVKNKPVDYGNTHYKHATLDHIADAISQAMSPHGLSFTWDVEQNGAIRVTCIVTHSQGHSERVSLSADSDTSGSKNSIQAIGSTITYLQRYTLLSATGLAAKDDDDDGRTSESLQIITDKQVAEIIALLDEAGIAEARYLKHNKLNTLHDIQIKDYMAVVESIEKTK